jgi:RimJ/RimL family protein N-acetyltransferase
MAELITLMPLDRALHTAALQAVYSAVPAYWQLYRRESPPPEHASQELSAAEQTPGRTLLGILRRVDRQDPEAGAELIGVLDFRLHWPTAGVAYVGNLMVVGSLQRRGIASQAWALLKPWLASSASMQEVRTGVEQFNIAALKFWEAQGLTLTGASDRVRVEDRFVRLLYLAADLGHTM